VRLRAAQLAFLLAVLAAWQGYYESGLGEDILVKSPGDVWSAFTALIEAGSLWTDLSATMEATVVALVLGTLVGVVLGIGLALLPKVEAVVAPYLDALNAMPRIALAPVFIVYFGIGMAAKVALAFSLVVFIVLINTRAGVRNADPDVLQLSTVVGSTRRQTFTKVLLPVAVPSIFAGIRLGLIYSLLGVVGSEVIAAKDGLGQQVAASSATFDMATVYAVLLLLAVIAAILNAGSAKLERWLLRWQAPEAR
jgi:NitT/TauT family transport system permease protein